MIEVIRTVSDWKKIRKQIGTLGFVPTMGALHEGHLSLVKKSLSENDKTLVSIFVNPTQFDNQHDLNAYPKTLEKDLELLKGAGAHYVFSPDASELYPDKYNYRVNEHELSHVLCGAHRPGHFEGMLTVVLKLLQIAQADRSYFGEKDFQQLLLIKGMVNAFFIATEIVNCPTVREADGLAMSSRNTRLNPDQRRHASIFPQLLNSSLKPSEIREELEKKGFRVDYIDEHIGRRFGAVHLDSVRLIDNVPV